MSIELVEASYSYRLTDGTKNPALSPITMSVGPGEFVAVIGANGSGKSTLAKLISGLISAESGSVNLDGRRLDPADLSNRKNVGMLFQNPDNQIVATIVEDDVAFGPENLGVPPAQIRERVDKALARVKMSAHIRDDPNNLSAGQKQRVAMAGLLAMRPKYMILDEPTSLLDPPGRQEVMTVLSEIKRLENIGIVYITHIIEEAARADRVLVLSEGEIVAQGEPRALLTDSRLMDRVSLYSPKPNQLAGLLREKGVPIPGDILTGKELAEAIC